MSRSGSAAIWSATCCSASGVRVSSWSSRAMYSPVASSRAVLVAAEIPPAVWCRREVDAGVRGGVAVQCGDDLWVGGAVVHQAQLPVGERLCLDGGDRLFEHVQGWVVDWGQHRDQRRVESPTAIPNPGRAVGRRSRDRRGGGSMIAGLQPDRACHRPGP